MTLPPAPTMLAAPAVPSMPIPVSTTPSTQLFQTFAADMNKGSTAGLQKFTGGPSSSAITAVPSRRATRMWRAPGAI